MLSSTLVLDWEPHASSSALDQMISLQLTHLRVGLLIPQNLVLQFFLDLKVQFLPSVLLLALQGGAIRRGANREPVPQRDS